MSRGTIALLFLLCAGSLLPPARGATTRTPQQQLGALVSFLKSNGYSSFLKAIIQQRLGGPMLNLLKAKQSLTLLAPRNKVWAAIPRCKLTISKVLLDHIVRKRISASEAISAPVGSKYVTAGPDRLTKVSSKPLRFGLVSSKGGKTLAVTRVTRPNAFKQPQIVVHRISKVLAYCS